VSGAYDQLARDFFAALGSGDVPDDLLTDDMTGWTSNGTLDRATFQGAMKFYVSVFADGPVYTIDSLTAEDDRVAAEVRSSGTLVNGQPFDNTHVYILRIRDGRVAHMAEHMNQLVVRDQIVPLMQAAMAKSAG
jgi:ketosteroid isomerase-like protein